MTETIGLLLAIWGAAFLLALAGSGPFVRLLLRKAGKEFRPMK